MGFRIPRERPTQIPLAADLVHAGFRMAMIACGLVALVTCAAAPGRADSSSMPASARLRSFEAKLAVEGGVDLTWAADVGNEIQAWNLYRGRSSEDTLERVNSTPIAASHRPAFSFHDASAFNGEAYYRLAAILADSSEHWMGEASLDLPSEVKAFSFGPAHPNPFHDGVTTIDYELPQRTRVRLEVFDASGQRLRTLVNAVQEPGMHTATFDLHAGSGRPLGGGLYVLRIIAGREYRKLRVVALDRDPWVGPIYRRRPR